MSQRKKQIRKRFRESVFHRDHYMCLTCGDLDGRHDAHHITDRSLMPNGGYVLENGITFCESCHEKAEAFHSTGTPIEGYEPETLYRLIGSSYSLAVKKSELLE